MYIRVEDMEKMVALTGGVMFSFIGFILPGAFYLRLRPPHVDGRPSGGFCEVAMAVSIVMLGIVVLDRLLVVIVLVLLRRNKGPFVIVFALAYSANMTALSRMISTMPCPHSRKASFTSSCGF